MAKHINGLVGVSAGVKVFFANDVRNKLAKGVPEVELLEGRIVIKDMRADHPVAGLGKDIPGVVCGQVIPSAALQVNIAHGAGGVGNVLQGYATGNLGFACRVPQETRQRAYLLSAKLVPEISCQLPVAIRSRLVERVAVKINDAGKWQCHWLFLVTLH